MPRQTTFLKAGTHEPKWVVVDAANVPLGRLAARIATVLQGKHSPDWTPHAMSGDYVIVINASQVALTGRKSEQKMRKTYSGHPGGLKHIPYGRKECASDHRGDRNRSFAFSALICDQSVPLGWR